MTPFMFAAQCIAICASGFDNEHHHAAWLKKHRKEIDALPLPLKKKVLAAHENATAKAFSK